VAWLGFFQFLPSHLLSWFAFFFFQSFIPWSFSHHLSSSSYFHFCFSSLSPWFFSLIIIFFVPFFSEQRQERESPARCWADLIDGAP
jgi:hypothetical protein